VVRLAVWHLSFFPPAELPGPLLASPAKQAFLTPSNKLSGDIRFATSQLREGTGFCDLKSAGFQRRTELSITWGLDDVERESNSKRSRDEREPRAIFLHVRNMPCSEHLVQCKSSIP